MTTPTAEAVDASGRVLSLAQAVQRLRSTRHLLLGEIHDNPEHHRIRAALLREMLADGLPTWVVFEQMDRQHNAAIAAAPRNTDAVMEAGRLDQKNWVWPLHRPLLDAALAGGATVLGGNLSRAEATQVVRGGITQVPADLRRYLSDTGDDATPTPSRWTAALDTELARQIDAGHCGALPAKMVAPMALAQRARDAALASAMLQAPAGTRVVLIAGNGHVRRDIGVPHYLLAKAATSPNDARMVSIGFLERAADSSTSVDGPYDEAWFTARVARPDPCESFRPPSPSP
ncbi:MAG: ChaN family lipoprotein [Burkholderiaceae bacterium]|nr:ChaN family lipoprotein [Burkholderiaceae bacterium]